MTDFVMVNRALQFASIAHRGQVRKYTQIAYISHPVELMLLLLQYGCTDTAMLCAALLHDVVEDCEGYDMASIDNEFGMDVAGLVEELTDDKIEGNRAARKAWEVIRIADISDRAKTIKCADLISNTRDIAMHDQNFAKLYLKEKRAVLEVLTGAEETILRAAWLVLEEAEKHVFQS